MVRFFFLVQIKTFTAEIKLNLRLMTAPEQILTFSKSGILDLGYEPETEILVRAWQYLNKMI